MSEHSAHEDPAKQFPGRTTPTWEIELLLSGATVFALVQFAGALPEWGGYLLPRLSELWQQVLRTGLIYLQCGVIVLCVAFVLHLLLRAYWVALVGMDSVYPGGLKADRLRGGPIGKDWVLGQWKPMADQIEQADNRASIVFGLGIGLARMMVNLTIFGSLLLALALGLAAITGEAAQADDWILAIFALVLLPYFLLLLLDRYLGHRLRAGSWLYRAVRATHALTSRIGLGRESAPLVALYTSNVGEDRGNWIVGTIVGVATIASIASLDMLDDELGWGHYWDFPTLSAAAPQTVRHLHYASLHEPGESPRSPFLPDLQARGRYLPLVLPYVPTVHGHLLDGCLDDEEVAAEQTQQALETRTAAQLACLAEGFGVSLDGQPLDQAPALYSDARRDLRGLVYMIPLTGQSRGRHELVVVLRPKDAPAKGEPPPTWRIPYWY